jgi:hypothetical protein
LVALAGLVVAVDKHVDLVHQVVVVVEVVVLGSILRIILGYNLQIYR